METSPRSRSGGFLQNLLVFGFLVLLPSSAYSQQVVGTIAGRVTDVASGVPLAYANVVLLDTQWGGMSADDGAFRIENIPVGVYVVKASYMGYEPVTVEGVEVVGNTVVTVDFEMKATVVGQVSEIKIFGKREELIDLKSTSVKTGVSAEDISSLPVDEITEAIGLKAGVVARGGELHFRGGRAGEVAVLVDGVQVRDPLSGGSADLSQFAVEDAVVILGGLDAKYGNAQSGIINYKTREGGDHLSGEIRYETDDFGAPDKTYDNLDRILYGMGGPLPIQNMNYYVSAQGVWTDAYPATKERRNHRRVLDFISIGERKYNDVRLQGKLTWKPGIPYKLSLEYMANNTSRDIYYHNWSWEGYVKTFLDTLETDEVLLRRGPWSPFRVDDSYEYYNAAEHTPDVDERFRQIKFAFTHNLGGGNSFYSVKLARHHFRDAEVVGGKNPWEYAAEDRRDLYYDYENNIQSLFFVRGGDYPSWTDRDTKVYSGLAEVTHRWRNHTFEAGGEFKYNDLSYHHVEEMYINRDNAMRIGRFDQYHYYQPEGAAYLQDRWEHEGMVLNIGVRFDAFSVGGQIDPAEVDERVKQQFSPRIGIAYPISDRDVFSFHYGRYYQFPDRQYLYENRSVFDQRTRGNPNLSNETTVSYQAAIQHLFSETVRGQFSVYYKDIFGLLASEQIRTSDSANLVYQFYNRDYASSRGFESSLERSFAGGFTGEVAYTYGIATGVASDPEAANEQNFRYLPISEQPLSWDQRHSFSTQFTAMDPGGNWSLGVVWQIRSGFPYTPRQRDQRDLEPEVVNSRRLPLSTSLDLQAEKHYKVWGQPFKVFVRGSNVLDTRNIENIGPFNWPLAPGLDPFDYDVYFTETGHAGGAYSGEDVNGDGQDDFVPLHDPRVFGEGRSVRMGISLTF